MNVVELDGTQLIVRVTDAQEAKALPLGIAVGDKYGGRSFNDNIAAVLESRSRGGWQEIAVGEATWTVIVLNR